MSEMKSPAPEAGNSSVFINDLGTEVTDSEIYNIFSEIGRVKNIKLIINSTNDDVLSHAYITYEKPEDAARAISEVKFVEIRGVPIKIVVPSKTAFHGKRSANLVILNLPSECNNSLLLQTFSIFGEIMSHKVVFKPEGTPANYGFVQFKSSKSAKKAILFGNGKKLLGKSLLIKKVVPAAERFKKDPSKKKNFTNVFLKNFPLTWKEKDLLDLLGKYGDVDSSFFPLRADNTPKGFACANFAKAEDAIKAIEELHQSNLFKEEEGVFQPFYIQKAEMKESRSKVLKNIYSRIKTTPSSFKSNLYIRNIPGGYTRGDLMGIFSQFGKVTSMSLKDDSFGTNNNYYALIAFSTPQEAAAAVEKGNGIWCNNRRLEVKYFRNRRERETDVRDNSVNFKRMSRPYVPREFKPNKTKELITENGGPNDGKSDDEFTENLDAKLKIGLNDLKIEKEKVVVRIANLAETFRGEWEKLGIETKDAFIEFITDEIMKESNGIRNVIFQDQEKAEQVVREILQRKK